MKKNTKTRHGVSITDAQLIVYDFDGVMTDNKVLVSEDGKESVFCNRSDGLAIQQIKRLGISQIILSTEHSRVVEARAKKLGIEFVQGVSDKKAALMAYCRKKKINLKKVIYIGNDINDAEAMKIVGFPMAPQDAACKIRDISKAILRKKGGDGVIKDFLETFWNCDNCK